MKSSMLVLVFALCASSNNAMEHYKKMKNDYWTIKQLVENNDINLEALEKDLTLGAASQIIYTFFGAEQLKKKYALRLELVKEAKELREKKKDSSC